ncbi:MAG TPA: hypothetical protein VGN53_10400, partial [Klebsiella sp.]
AIFAVLFQQHSDSTLTQLWRVTVCSFGCHVGSPFTESLVSRKPSAVQTALLRARGVIKE